MKPIAILAACGPALCAAEPLITFENRPMGTVEKPLVLRSYLPDPDLDHAVFSQHDTAAPVPKYNPDRGADVPGEVPPIAGLAASIGVNFGPALSYVFDTTECRLLYAWQGGFVDMTPYWGDPQRGNRTSFGYVPKLVGTLFWKATGNDPLELDGKSISDHGPRTFTGYHLVKGVPTFEFKAGDTPFTLTLAPSETPLASTVTVTTPTGRLSWRGIEGATAEKSLTFTLAGSELATFQGHQPEVRLTSATAAAGSRLFLQYGCAACHSTDGSKSHGPSIGGLFGRDVEIDGSGEKITADHAYLIESIKTPNAKVVKGYPPNYMPPFALQPLEYESLALYIESLATPE